LGRTDRAAPRAPKERFGHRGAMRIKEVVSAVTTGCGAELSGCVSSAVGAVVLTMDCALHLGGSVPARLLIARHHMTLLYLSGSALEACIK